jgi:hypothetical protein
MNGYNGSKVLGDFVVPYIFETPRTCGKMLQDTALLNAPIEESLHWQLVSPQKAQDEGSQGFQEQPLLHPRSTPMISSNFLLLQPATRP